MLFEYEITIPANTPEKSPVRQRLEITRGVIKKLGVFFPYGCLGLVKCRIKWGEHQVFPRNLGGFIRGNDETIDAEYFLYLDTEPYELIFEGWSEDELYDHTVSVRINVIPLWALYPFSMQMYEMIQKEVV